MIMPSVATNPSIPFPIFQPSQQMKNPLEKSKNSRQGTEGSSLLAAGSLSPLAGWWKHFPSTPLLLSFRTIDPAILPPPSSWIHLGVQTNVSVTTLQDIPNNQIQTPLVNRIWKSWQTTHQRPEKPHANRPTRPKTGWFNHPNILLKSTENPPQPTRTRAHPTTFLC